MTKTQTSLAMIIVLSLVGVLALWTFHPPPGSPDQINTMINILVGVLAAGATAVIGFLFGSSESSKRKDDTLGDIAKSSTGTPLVTPTEAPVVIGVTTGDFDGDPLPRK